MPANRLLWAAPGACCRFKASAAVLAAGALAAMLAVADVSDVVASSSLRLPFLVQQVSCSGVLQLGAGVPDCVCCCGANGAIEQLCPAG